MNKNKYLLLGSSIGALLLLIVAAAQDGLREWRRIQRVAVTDEGSIKVRIRQVVSPGLGTSDRCVSCHVGMDPSEQGVRGSELLVAHKPVVHDLSDFGCTICHGGQGMATEKLDAHGDVPFWPEPMIPRHFSQAGCGTCHANPGVPNQELFEQARLVFEQLDCLACHRLDDRGGTIRPNGFGMEGPDLSRVGITGYDKDWYDKHLAQSSKAVSGPWRTSFDPISETDLNLLAIYLSTRVAAPKLIEAKVVFLSNGCMGCHKVSGVGGDEGLELTKAGEKDPGQLAFSGVQGKHTLENWFGEHFKSPSGIVAGSAMPAVALDDEDIDRLTLYALSLRRRDLPGAYLPRDRVSVEKFGVREFSSDGATVFSAFCAGCHGRNGQGKRAPDQLVFPAIAHPDFLGLVSDEFILDTITRGRPGRKMPAWGVKDGGLKSVEISNVTAYLRKLGNVDLRPDPKPSRWISANAAAGKSLFAANCASCHGNNGQGGIAPALNKQILLANGTDTYFVETISRGRSGTEMEGFLTPSPRRATLSTSEIEDIVAYIRSWEGEKK